MNQEAIRHTGAYPDIYLKDRRTMMVVLRTARKDVTGCSVVYFPRTDKRKIKKAQMQCVLRDERFDYYQLEISFSKVARYQKYYFEINDQGKLWYLTAWGIGEQIPEDGYFEFLYANGTEVVNVPEWSKGLIYYQIFPERFYNGDTANDPKGCMKWGSPPTRDNYMGGDLEGILRKMGYLDGLGIECIYLTAIFEADFNHKYATTDYYKIDPSFGIEDILRSFVKEAHSIGMKIILDGVFNHTGIHFKPFQDVLKNQEHSDYRDWLYITEYPVRVSHHCYECVGAYKYMPKLNTANPEVRSYLLRVMEYWIREFKIDGWRLDVADEVDEGVWMEARIMLKSKYPDILLLGETWGDGLRLMNGAQMDCIMNYVFRDAVRDFLALERINGSGFDARIQKMLSHYPESANQAMFLPLDSHDTERFLYDCRGDKRKLILAVCLQMTFPGAPSVYYGDEVGMTGANDPDCRQCMVWEKEKQDSSLFSIYQKLIHLRKQEKCIKNGGFAVNVCEGRVYGYVRYDDKNELYIILNAGKESRIVNVPVLDKKQYVDVATKQEYKVEDGDKGSWLNSDMWHYEGMVEISLEPYSAKILKGRPAKKDSAR